MPRIAINIASGEATVDVCGGCFGNFIDGDLVPDTLSGRYPDATVADTEREHPCYDSGEYYCETCGCRLEKDDN